MAASVTGPPLGRDDLVTGEAVALDLPVAGFGSRLVGGLIDATLQVVLIIVMLAAMSAVKPLLDNALAQAAAMICVAGVLWLVPMTVEILSHGRSLGKLAAGTRVVRADHGELSPRHSLVRWTIGLAEMWATSFTPAVLSLILTRRTQRLGDLAAGTIVVKDRLPIILPTPVAMPPHLIPWAQACDLGAVPPRLAMSARLFLARRTTLSPQARNRLGHDLAAQARACVSPAPPPAHPEDVLAAVLAERARRDRIRWAQSSAHWSRLTDAARARNRT